MKYRKQLLAVLLLLAVAGCVVCMQKKRNDLKAPYISFTVDYTTKLDYENDIAEFGVTICDYDLETKAVSEIYSFPGSAMYPLGVHDKQSNAVYYVKEAHNTAQRLHTGDQIFVHHLDTGQDEMLTDDLLAVNYIIPVKDAVFFVAARQCNQDSVILGKIHLKDGRVQYWDEPDTASIITIGIDRVCERIYVSSFDADERDHAVITNGPPPTYSIWSYDYNLQDKKEILHKDQRSIKSLYAMDGKLLYRADDTLAPGSKTHFYSEVIDLETMDVLLHTEEAFPYRGSFTMDQSGIYCVVDDGEHAILSQYNFNEKEYVPIVQSSIGNIINFQLLYYT